MKKLFVLISCLILVVGCKTTTEPVVNGKSLGTLGASVNLAYLSAVAYYENGKINDLHFQYINEKYNNFRYQLDLEVKASRMVYTVPASSELQKLADKVFVEIQPHAPLDYNPNIILDR